MTLREIYQQIQGDYGSVISRPRDEERVKKYLVKFVKFKQEENEFYQYCYDICRYHHERSDGKGYPDMFSGEDIPIWAQIVSIVDVYDALVSKRVYKIPYAVEEEERMILAGECGVFSPKIIDCFEAAKLELFQLTEGKFKFLEE